MGLRPLAFAIRGVAKEDSGRFGASRGAVVADVSPEPALLGRAATGTQDRNRCVIAVQLRARHDIAPERVDERLEQRTGSAHPVGQCGAIEVQTFALVNLALPVKGQVIRILRYQDVGEEARTCQAARDRPAGRWRLYDLLTVGTGELRAHVPDHLVAPGQELDHLADIFAEAAQCPAAGGTGARRLMHNLFAGQVIGERAADWLLRRLLRSRPHVFGLLGKARFEILERQLHLRDALVELFGGAAEPCALQTSNLKTQLLKLERLGDKKRFCDLKCAAALAHDALQSLDVVRQIHRFGHAALYRASRPLALQNTAKQGVLDCGQRCVWALDPSPINPLEQHRELRAGQCDRPVRGLRPHESASFKSLREET